MPWMRCATGLDRFAPPGPLGRNEIPFSARRVCGRRTGSGSLFDDRHRAGPFSPAGQIWSLNIESSGPVIGRVAVLSPALLVDLVPALRLFDSRSGVEREHVTVSRHRVSLSLVDGLIHTPDYGPRRHRTWWTWHRLAHFADPEAGAITQHVTRAQPRAAGRRD